ncbi:uncharacterized protein LOC115767372 [Drosophila novamexicana]|uniref:uncharacterized protein LOC115767372 n=1 Tax=Drosophila novamexicana TaxID=47314 RepID=UPI0011E5E0BA|nr:uncharacterized protein LOC115767372 [Drosophila novamexicana]
MSDKQQQKPAKPAKAAKDANPGSSGNSNTRPNASQMEQTENTNVFKQLFATLEAEHQKLQDLEQRRLKLTEEMKNLRDMLQQENRRLRSSSEEAQARNNASAGSTSAGTVLSSLFGRKSKSVKIAKQPPKQIAHQHQMPDHIDQGIHLNTLENQMAGRAGKEELQLMPAELCEPPGPQTSEVLIQLIDSSSAMRQLQTIELPALWHTPVSSVDLESFLQMSNTSVAQSSTDESRDAE